MMNTFERPMRKDFDKKGKLKQYIISLGVNTEINEDRFYKNQNGKMVCDVIVCFPDEYQKFSNDIENSQTLIQSLNDKIQAKDKTIERLENKLTAIYSDHQKEMDDLKDEYNGEVKQLKKDLHDKDIEIERTKTKYEKEIGQIKAANLNHINGIIKFDDEKHMLIKDHNEEVSSLKESQFNPESDMKISDHNRQVNGIKNRIVETVIPHNDNINRLDSIGLWALFKGELKEVKKDLKKDIQAFEDIAHYIESKNENVVVELKKEKKDE